MKWFTLYCPLFFSEKWSFSLINNDQSLERNIFVRLTNTDFKRIKRFLINRDLFGLQNERIERKKKKKRKTKRHEERIDARDFARNVAIFFLFYYAPPANAFLL